MKYSFFFFLHLFEPQFTETSVEVKSPDDLKLALR